ncbi:BON domain-containing protein [Paraburkholderia pallida]|uniref:BON domain-containing protein n=1 Tax=Paraburkholderia pallida TaxID=2547399 RepID=A0A4P7CZ94_9BURK|nr:BON domain-containing protein [Paraburkholderia pallida]QBR00177.1 BON domain-containing protein [Paraburkholderia pallida]
MAAARVAAAVVAVFMLAAAASKAVAQPAPNGAAALSGVMEVTDVSVADTANSASAAAANPDEIRNWYNDPFFALSNAPGACPQPLGPRMTKAEADDDAHYRVERGTTCWLAHKCTKPNSYLYDADIAKAIREQFKGDPSLAGASLWITVQRRFVYAEGCAPAAFDRAALERRLAAIPDVDKVFVRLRADPHALPPYKTLPPVR